MICANVAFWALFGAHLITMATFGYTKSRIRGRKKARHEWRTQGPHGTNADGPTCMGWSGRPDLNWRPLRPERSALAKLSYAPKQHR